jgi:hypothetical protein
MQQLVFHAISKLGFESEERESTYTKRQFKHKKHKLLPRS